MLATLDRGDTVLVPNPSYPIHIYGAVIAGANIRSVPMTPGLDFFEEIERAVRESIPKPKMMILGFPSKPTARSEEHTSELQSLMRISYAVFCLNKKKNPNTQ